MTIDEKTAQLILDALAWSNDNWRECIDESQHISAEDRIAEARADFLGFCRARGIEDVVVRK